MGGGRLSSDYAVADIMVDAASNTWHQIYPAPGSVSTTSPTSPSTTPTTAEHDTHYAVDNSHDTEHDADRPFDHAHYAEHNADHPEHQ